MNELKAHEVTTVVCSNGVGRSFMKKYIVITTTASRAIRLTPLQDGEEVLKAEELHHEVIVDGE